MKILVVDDDPRLRDLVRLAAERAGFSVITAADGQACLTHLAREAPDLIILDIGLPEMDGFETCRRIRQRSEVPVLFLTARDDEIDRIVGLELGADDYVTKPFSPRELIARVRAILKRSAGQQPSAPLQYGRLSLDPGARICRTDQSDLALTATEFQLLARLMADAGRFVPREALISAVWGPRSAVSGRTLDSHLRNLRQKLSTAGLDEAIGTLHGQGFRLEAR
ncbi:response regulator transcription factor [Xinfangfangia sp. D13-10-4-6]|uniref:response regulator transcription factor n=1 Tax=Pseudogemmobacter hezensis TaxID=2737662 RepID=UPI0015535EC7|nr:response regulator transcription factor [Pseudogemmobacter hezensis]NPD15651.1 response regulator transcription factor [Pseudogemmobacter hezensis]